MSIWKNGKLVAGGRQATPLLSFMWADHILDEISWLRADTFSWQSGSVYQAVYQHLANDIDGKSLQSETIGGTTIQFYLANDGHKICPESEMSNVAAIYAATGVAWYYIIDTVNERFKLPRTKFGFTGLRDNVGDCVEPELPNIVARLGGTISWARDNPFYGSGNTGSCSGSNYGMQNTMMDLSRVNPIFKDGATVQPPATQMYLYFYVGEFTQTALENTAGITAETLNDKVDKGHQVIAFQAPTAGNNYTWYRKYADGWVEQGGAFATVDTSYHTESITLSVAMSDANYSCFISCASTGSAYVPLIQNKTTTGFVAYNVVNATAYAAGWQVSGMAAS